MAKVLRDFSLTVVVLWALSSVSFAEQRTALSQYGITWTFDQAYETGQFANGDWWVVGPVSVVSIDPPVLRIVREGEDDDFLHGSMVNPVAADAQSYDSRANGYNHAKNVGLGVTPSSVLALQPISSLVSSISFVDCDDPDAHCPNGSMRPVLKTAAVLTVLATVPPDSGATMFRPGFSGTDKDFFYLSDLETGLLPSFAPPANYPTLPDVAESLQRVQLDHRSGWSTRLIHPRFNMPDYGSDISNRYSSAILRLLLDDSLEDKMPALVNTVQAGIDYYSMRKNGTDWVANGGHSPGRKLMITFAGVLLDDTAIKQAVSNAPPNIFDEDMSVRYREPAGRVLFAQTGPSPTYWQKLVFGCDGHSGSKTDMDPYGYIDGGCCVGCTYDNCCLFKPWRAEAIAMYMFPELKLVWNDPEFFEFVNRRTYHGAWAQPDPCAPVTGLCVGGPNDGADCTAANGTTVCEDGTCDYSLKYASDFGVAYGPDPNDADDCIRDTDPSDGIGRYPQNHGLNRNSGGYSNGFADSLWELYRLTPCSNGVQDIDEEGIDCGGVCEVDLDGDGYNRGVCAPALTDCDDDDSDDPYYAMCPSASAECEAQHTHCAVCVNPGMADPCDGIDNNCDGTFHPDYYTDTDLDGLNNCIDNCPDIINPDQADLDYDGIGDDCDPVFQLTADFELIDENDFSEAPPGGLAFVNVSRAAHSCTGSHLGHGSKALCLSGPGEGDPIKLVVSEFGVGEWKDYVLRLRAGDKYTHSGLVLNYSDPNNYYWVSLRDDKLKKLDNGATSEIDGSGDSIRLDWGGDTRDYALRCAVRPDGALVIHVWRDDYALHRVFVDPTPHLSRGAIGFITVSGGGGNYFLADDLQLLFPLEGDISGDGTVSAYDASLVSQLVSDGVVGELVNRELADRDLDGVIGLNDAHVIAGAAVE